MRFLSDFWNDAFNIPEARLILFATILVCSVLVAVYVSLFFRNLAVGRSDDDSVDLLSQFRELSDSGKLDETEYSKLKQAVRGVTPTTSDEQQYEKKFMTLAEAESKKRRSDCDRKNIGESNEASESD